MTDEQFQKQVLEKLVFIEEKIETELNIIKSRQDEIIKVVRAIEHSNDFGRAKIDEYKTSNL